jgi:rRNA-processing protein FCF1
MVNENLRGSRKMNHVVLDTNVVIDLFHVEYVKAITQLLKNRQNIIVCDTVLEEASRKLKLRPTTIKTKLEKPLVKDLIILIKLEK